MRWACLLVVLSLGGSVVSAQSLRDLEGEWTLIESVGLIGEPPVSMTVRAVVVDTTVRGEPMAPFVRSLEIARTEAGTHTTESIDVGMVGGVVSGTAYGRDGEPKGRRLETFASARWDGQRLTRYRRWTERASTGELNVERTDEWSKDSDGRLVIRVRISKTGAEPDTATFLYRGR